MSDTRVVLLVLALLPGVVLAQSADLAPPPLVEAPAAEEAPEAPVPDEALPSSAVPEAVWRPDPPGRVMGRVLLESMVGTLGGIGGGLAGALGSLGAGGLSVGCVDICNGEPVVGGALVGWSLGTAVGVYGAGTYLDGRGRFLPTLGVGLLTGGAAAGLYMAEVFDDDSILPLFFGLPLVASIITYEVTSARTAPPPRSLAASRNTGAWWTPTVQVSPRGGALGLTGRF